MCRCHYRQVAWPKRIDAIRYLWLFFCFIDRIIGRSIEDDTGTICLYDSTHEPKLNYITMHMIQGNTVMIGQGFL